jgi:hypothetical protein
MIAKIIPDQQLHCPMKLLVAPYWLDIEALFPSATSQQRTGTYLDGA